MRLGMIWGVLLLAQAAGALTSSVPPRTGTCKTMEAYIVDFKGTKSPILRGEINKDQKACEGSVSKWLRTMCGVYAKQARQRDLANLTSLKVEGKLAYFDGQDHNLGQIKGDCGQMSIDWRKK